MAQPVTLTEMDGGGVLLAPEANKGKELQETSPPRVVPLSERHYFTAQELQDIRDRTPEAIAKWPALCGGNQNYGR